MGLRRARELVALMVREFQPYGATWAELKNKSGIPPTSYKRAFNRVTEMKWLWEAGNRVQLTISIPMDAGEQHYFQTRLDPALILKLRPMVRVRT